MPQLPASENRIKDQRLDKVFEHGDLLSGALQLAGELPEEFFLLGILGIVLVGVGAAHLGTEGELVGFPLIGVFVHPSVHGGVANPEPTGHTALAQAFAKIESHDLVEKSTPKFRVILHDIWILQWETHLPRTHLKAGARQAQKKRRKKCCCQHTLRPL